MSSILVRFSAGLVLWGTGIAGALWIAQWPGDWGHGICGPWGCGPPIQTLVSCHLAWLVLLTPPAMLLLRRAAHRPQRLGWFLILLAVAGLLSVVAYQWATWWPGVSEWQRPFFWQRCGFVIVTAVDFPVVQTLAIGVLLLVGPIRRGQPPSDRVAVGLPQQLGGESSAFGS